jgi:hypothetical protein
MFSHEQELEHVIRFMNSDTTGVQTKCFMCGSDMMRFVNSATTGVQTAGNMGGSDNHSQYTDQSMPDILGNLDQSRIFKVL